MRNPWAAPRPFVLDMTAATAELSYEPVVTYEEAIAETVDWIATVVSNRDWKEALPRAADYLAQRFDYDAEDAFIRARS